MPPASDITTSPPLARYMTMREVANELGLKSTGSVYNKIYAGQLIAVDIATTGKSQLRVTRESFEDYCRRIEAEAATRFKAS